jgi:hypothetical protein
VGPDSTAEDAAVAIASAEEALELVEQISYRGDSHLSAELRGGPQFIGWTEDRYLAADTRDLILTLLAGLGGDKVSPSELWTRPRAEEVKPVQAQTIADFDDVAFIRWLMS